MAETLLMSAYEVARQRLIDGNKAMLESLGLSAASGSPKKTKPLKIGEQQPVAKSNRKRKSAAVKVKAEPVRRSNRIRGMVRHIIDNRK